MLSVGWRGISKRFIYAVCSLLPVLFIVDWGNGWFEPKVAATLACGVACAVSIFVRLWKNESIKINYFILGLLGLLFFKLISLINLNNIGLHEEAIGLNLVAIAVAIYVYNSNLNIRSLSKFLAFPILPLVICALARILTKVTLFNQYNPFGVTIGTKNSFTIYLAQMIPFVLVLIYYFKRDSKRVLKISFLVFLLGLMTWIMYAQRTRSAWWMLIIYLVGLIIPLLLSRKKELKTVFGSLILGILLGIFFLLAVPNELKWNSKTPYFQSLSTLASVEHSSGRDKVWKVGWQIIKDHPFIGIGAGNYAPLWPGYIKETNIDPKIFAFLIIDLPALNDYLQSAIECGLLAGLLFFLTMFCLPAISLYRLSKSPDSYAIPEFLLALMCFATSLDAILDYPFTRPETYMYFIIAFSFVAKKTMKPVDLAKVFSRRKALVFTASQAIIIFVICLTMTLGLSFRRMWDFKKDNIRLLQWAFFLWPWDPQWDSTYQMDFLRAGKEKEALAYTSELMKMWPYNAEGPLAAAQYYEFKKNYKESLKYYKQAVNNINTRCYIDGFSSYYKMIHDPGFPKDLDVLTPQDTLACVTQEAELNKGLPPTETKLW